MSSDPPESFKLSGGFHYSNFREGFMEVGLTYLRTRALTLIRPGVTFWYFLNTITNLIGVV